MSYIKQADSGGGDTYTLKAAQSGADVDIQLDATTGADSDVKLKAGTNITLTEASDTITIDAAGGSPGGSNTQVQFNDGGSFGGDDAFTYDKTNDRVKIGNATIQEDTTMKLHVVGSDANLCIEDQDDGSSSGPSVRFSRISASPAASDVLGQMVFRGKQTGGSGVVSYGSVRQEIVDPASGTKTGRMVFKTINSNTQSDKMQIDSQITSLVNHNFQGLIKVNNQAGTSGQVLTSQGPSADPIWAAAGGGGQSPIGLPPAGNFTAQPLHASRPWGTNRSSTSTTSDSNASCRPFFVGQAGTVATMIVYVTGGSSGDYLAGIYSDDGGKPSTLLGQASFASSGGAGQRTATSFTAADGTTSRTIVLAANTQYWYATVKESGNGSLRSTDPGRTPFLMQDDSTGVANTWYSSYRDSAANNAFEDTWDISGSSPSTFVPGSVWVVMS